MLRRALSHRSSGSDNNERLEFLGDSILNFVVGEALYQQFPEADEGELSRMRAQLVKGKTLAMLAKSFSLGDFLLLGPGEMKSGGHRRESILADTMEALIATIYLQAGLDVCRRTVLFWYQSLLADISPAMNKDPKTQLQEWLQARREALPQYELAEVSGAEHEQQFLVTCLLPSMNFSITGKGRSRRKAEQAAASSALERLQQ